ncbi:MAG: hypothetical protein LC775_04720, partial [Acidobacteria bacterium]|nr:hypothetical protein [Acidobacteriota bacterium]
MRYLVLILTLAIAALAFGGFASSQVTRPTNTKSPDQATTKAPDQASVEQIIAGWKSKPQELARQMIA